MSKYSFKNDYAEGAHPSILNALGETNLLQDEGYGEDRFCLEAVRLLQDHIQRNSADIHFVAGGTLTNLIVIASVLKPYESVISATSGHICVHEAGAIEATGHKIISVKSSDGKLTPNNLLPVLEHHSDEHMVKPAMVYISNSTELGGIYRKEELEALWQFCRSHDLILFLDGARLGSALTSVQNDLTMPQLSCLVDVFYIGGTKNGALLGEAIVITNDRLKNNFRYHIKQRGALLAKGRILGLQFVELFKNDLFYALGRHANNMATRLAEGITKAGYDHWVAPVSNQIFPILPNDLVVKLGEKYDFYIWQKEKDTAIIRLITSWATKKAAVEAFVKDVANGA